MDTKHKQTMFVRAMYIMVILAVALSMTGSASALEPCGGDLLGCVTIGPSDPIHIAYALALSGPDPSLGVDSRNGIEIAIDDSGGEILGHVIQFDGVDESCSAEGGASAGATLAADPTIVAVIGTSCSVAARTAMPLLSEAGFAMVSPSNTGPDLTEPGNPNNYPGYLRVSWNDNVQGAVAARFAREYLGISTAATVNDESPYSVYLHQAFADEFTYLGGTITAQGTIDSGQTDLSAELASIAAGTPEMLYFPIFMPAGGYLINQARATAGLESAYLMGADGLWTEEIVTAAGGNVESFMVTQWDSTKNSLEYIDHFLPAYQAKFGEPISMFHAHAYDAFMMIKAAIEEVAVVDPDGTIQIGRQALRDALYGTTNFAGLTGNLTCNESGDCADPHIAVYKYHTDQFPPEYFWPQYPSPAPFIWADPICECLNGWDWSDGDTITIQVFDQDGNQFALQNPTQVYAPDVGVFFDLRAEGIDLQAGYRITMSNGPITKELIVSKLTVKEMNPVANTISGVFAPDLALSIQTGGQEPLSLDFDGDQWVATFESLPLDAGGEVYQPDNDGDKTGMGWDGVPTFMRYDIYALDVQSKNIKRVTMLDGTGEYNPSWSPNGKKIAHEVVYWDGSHGIHITDANTGVSHPLIGAKNGGNDAAWSPNGLWIVFDRRWVDDPNLYVVPFTGGQRRLVRANAVSASWSPNSLRMVVQDLADEGKVKTIGLLGQLEFTVADYGENPAWSPDGRWIAYQRDGDIWKVRVGLLGAPLGKPIQVTSLAAWEDQPTWSADSKTIVFHSGVSSDYDLWTVSAAGGMPTWLNGVPEYGDYDPAYSKNGRSISYASFSPASQAERVWISAFTYDLPAGTWSEGTHVYHFEAGGESGAELSFNVSNEASHYDGFALLRPFDVRARSDGVCSSIDTIHPDQQTRFHVGYLSDNVVYQEAVAYFDNLAAKAVWDGGMSADLVRHEIFPWTSQIDWPGYVCTYTQ